MNKAKLASSIVTLNIESFSHDGRGIAALNGKTTFVNGAIPGEIVNCKITKKHARYNEAEVTEITKSSPERIHPHCEHFNICGGCSLQHIHINTQIQLKLNVLLEQLKHFGHVTPHTILPPITGNVFGYRRKARLGVRFVRKKNKLLVGFREKSSNLLADIHTCPVLNENIGTRLSDLSKLIASLTQYEHIPQIEVAIGDAESALVFRHLTPLPEEDILKLQQFAERHEFHIYLQPNAPEPIHKIWPLHSEETLSYSLPDFQLKMKFSPLDFIQINGEVNQLLIKQALHLLDLQSTDQVLDLFCGLGNFTLPIARFAHEVTGVEGSLEMVKRAEENAVYNQITNATFFTANLMEPIASSSWLKKTYDKILLDPPRTGAKEIITHISHLAAKKIVYVSCNPATLARDAKKLVHHGYSLTHIGLVNMFPHTSHIEAIAVFEK